MADRLLTADRVTRTLETAHGNMKVTVTFDARRKAFELVMDSLNMQITEGEKIALSCLALVVSRLLRSRIRLPEVAGLLINDAHFCHPVVGAMDSRGDYILCPIPTLGKYLKEVTNLICPDCDNFLFVGVFGVFRDSLRCRDCGYTQQYKSCR